MKIIIIGLLLLCSINLFAEKIIISTNEYEPYVVLEKNGKHSGIMIEIVEKSFKKEGIDVEFKNYPFARATIKVDNNETDATMPKFKTEDRLKKYLFTEPITESIAKFFYIKGRNIPENFQWEKLQDLKKYKIGGTIGYWYLEEFEKAGLTVDIGPKHENNFSKLYIGRIDIFAIDEKYGWNIINKNYPKDVEKFATILKPQKKEELYLMLNKNNTKAKKIIKKFNSGLKKIKESGEYDEIIKKYK
jgi:polar amino acid transport system substrate-binding protein